MTRPLLTNDPAKALQTVRAPEGVRGNLFRAAMCSKDGAGPPWASGVRVIRTPFGGQLVGRGVTDKGLLTSQRGSKCSIG